MSDPALLAWAESVRKEAELLGGLNRIVQDQDALIKELLERVFRKNAPAGS